MPENFRCIKINCRKKICFLLFWTTIEENELIKDIYIQIEFQT
jgi:hypothetical protein